MNQQITDLLSLIKSDRTVIDGLEKARGAGSHLNISGPCAEQKAFLISALSAYKSKKPVVIVSDAARARTMSRALSAFTDGNVAVLMPAELSLLTAEASSRELELTRCSALSSLVTGNFGAAVITAGALMGKLAQPSEFASRIMELEVGGTTDPDDMIEKLTEMGYEKVPQVMERGEFARRGDIIDIFPADMTEPVRISFFDDEVDQLKNFDLETQRSTEQLSKVRIIPVRVYPAGSEEERKEAAEKIRFQAEEDISRMNKDSREARRAAELLTRTAEADAQKIELGNEPTGIARWISLLLDRPACATDYVEYESASDVLWFVDELIEADARMKAFCAEYLQRCTESCEAGTAPSCAVEAVFEPSAVMKKIDGLAKVITLATFASTGGGLPGGVNVSTSGFPSDNYSGRISELAEELKGTTGIKIVLPEGRRTENLRDSLIEGGALPDIIYADLPQGFSYPALGITLLGEQEIFGSGRTAKPKKKGGPRITFFGDIHPGDFIVHDKHGVGRYDGLVNMKVGDTRKDYLKITYARDEVLYILPENLDSLQKYVGPGEREPKLSRLGGDEWKRQVSRARETIKKVAYDLLKIYAARSVNNGFKCDPDDEQQKLFEDRFPHVETEDQLRACREIKADMESERPMDRLLCGDVGFGKTEVAFRAIFKAVMNGRQAIMLAPTTLLAQQHYQNFIERCKGFPVNVVMLSRFVPQAQIKANLIDIKNGKADVIIGTHRVLSNDVRPPHLGLLVVDEEQRFGVNHKEKIKSMKTDVDVLSLSATPIPRTLHMSLSGIRDISVLEEAPFNRRAVQTYVMGYDEQIIVQACMREIARGGQIFYLYNKTSDIDKVAEKLEELMPGVRVSYAHGQMPENGLETVVGDFVEGKYDILVCTTIIENGVDMPNVNTLIVENSDRFGLSQLYQIKGRVGRSDRQAYAYFTYDADAPLNEEATKRLNALREFTELGSGVRIAIRDLEVRGAGNLLGAEQHGQMDVIGYELYCRLLDEEIRQLGMNEAEKQKAMEGVDTLASAGDITIEVDYDAYIPSSYISDEASRMSTYRKIGSIRDFTMYDDFMDEITDRFGDPPKEIYILSGISLIRAMAGKLGFTGASVRNTGVRLYLDPKLQLDMNALGALLRDSFYGARVTINAMSDRPYLLYKPTTTKQSKTINEIKGILKILNDNKTANAV
ncbi:MAG: transcription-repair coupling factor [Clostridiales bacterium]|nr:transcription-repair coupling factor [Clostridiales bacterium]